MVKRMIKRIFGIIFLIAGLFYTVLPHSVHQRISPEWIIANNTDILTNGFPHFAHVIYGLVFIAYAIFLFSRSGKSYNKKRGKK